VRPRHQPATCVGDPQRRDFRFAALVAGHHPLRARGRVSIITKTILASCTVRTPTPACAAACSADIRRLAPCGLRTPSLFLLFEPKDGARKNPQREDVAESFLCYLAVRYRPDRISEADADKILGTIPNRIAYFDVLPLDMYPIAPGLPKLVKASASSELADRP
jgi:hypothetical protein